MALHKRECEPNTLDLMPITSEDPLATAMFYSIAINSIINNQMWFSPMGKGDELHEDWWVGTAVAHVIQQTYTSKELQEVADIFERRVAHIATESDFDERFNKQQHATLTAIQHTLAMSPKVNNAQFWQLLRC